MRAPFTLIIAAITLSLSSMTVAKSKVTPAQVTARFVQCVKKKSTCVEAKVFAEDAAKQWRRIKALIGTKLKVLSITLVETVPTKHQVSWKKTWTQRLTTLPRGFNRAALQQLGLGKGVVRASRSKAIAMLRTRTRVAGVDGDIQDVLFPVLAKGPRGWRIVALPNSAEAAIRALKK